MKYLLTLACLLFIPAAASADGYWQCVNGNCRWVQLPAPAVQRVAAGPSVESRLSALESRMQRVEDVIAATPEQYKTFQSTPLKVASMQATQPLATATRSTCNCSATGVCICDPATCACPSCQQGQQRLASSNQYAESSGYTMYAMAGRQPTARQQRKCQRWGCCP